MSTQHTPTPWSVHSVCSLELAEQNKVALGHPLSYEPGAFQIFTDDGRGNGFPLPEQDREANAAHIVRCVNSHDALVEALEIALATVELSTRDGAQTQPANWPHNANGDIDYEAFSILGRAALAKVQA